METELFCCSVVILCAWGVLAFRMIRATPREGLATEVALALLSAVPGAVLLAGVGLRVAFALGVDAAPPAATALPRGLRVVLSCYLLAVLGVLGLRLRRRRPDGGS